VSFSPRRLRSVLIIVTLVFALGAPGVASAAPVASFRISPPSPFTDEIVQFTSTSTGTKGPQRWDLDGDGACDDHVGKTAQRSYPSIGIFTVKLCVSGGVQHDIAIRRLTVRNRAPYAAFTQVPGNPLTGETITLVSVSEDPDGVITGQAWDLDNDGVFDDGTGVSATLSFGVPGAYTVRLITFDRYGAASVASQTVAVAARPPGLLEPFPMVRATARVTGKGTRFRTLSVTAPGGSKVTLKCRGKGCPARQFTKTAVSRELDSGEKISGLVRVRRFRHRALRPGARLSIWVTKPDRIGKYTSFTVRRAKAPRRKDGCVPPSATRPRRCES
jgi:PKD repeat protein